MLIKTDNNEATCTMGPTGKVKMKDRRGAQLSAGPCGLTLLSAPHVSCVQQKAAENNKKRIRLNTCTETFTHEICRY